MFVYIILIENTTSICTVSGNDLSTIIFSQYKQERMADESIFRFLIEVGKEHGVLGLILVIYAFIWPYYAYKFARMVINEKQKEVDRMAAEKERWEKLILGGK